MSLKPSAEVGDYLSKPLPMLIDGQWVQGSDRQAFEILDPSSESTVAEVFEASADDVDAAVAAARKAFNNPEWRRMATSQRTRLLLNLADLIEENAATLGELDVLSMGKPSAEAKVWDGPLSADMVRYQAGWCTKITGRSSTPTLPDMRGPGSFGTPYHSYSVRQPLGVAGIIIPWNAPLVMAVAKMAPALAAGCTVVLKPAEDAPLSPLMIGELIKKAGFPDGVVNIVPGFGEKTGAALVRHPDVDKISFTGSTEVGKSIIRTVADDMKRVTLELGGKSPVIVLEDADPAAVVPSAAMALYANCGQNCFAGSRLFVHRNHYEQIVDGIADVAKSLKVGPGLAEDTQIGPLINAPQRDKVAGFFDDMDGLEAVTGGSAMGDKGYFFEPSVVAGSNHNSRFFQEEIFGPVLTVAPFDEVDEVVARANDSTYGLAAGIFTNDLSLAHQVAGEIQAGAVWVNGYPVPDLNLPFGGFKQSGWGRENGEFGIESFTELKSVTMKL